MLSSASLPEYRSRSKLRRLRSAATKRNLYKSAHKDDALSMLTAQIAMMASSIDYIFYWLMCGKPGSNHNDGANPPLRHQHHSFMETAAGDDDPNQAVSDTAVSDVGAKSASCWGGTSPSWDLSGRAAPAVEHPGAQMTAGTLQQQQQHLSDTTPHGDEILKGYTHPPAKPQVGLEHFSQHGCKDDEDPDKALSLLCHRCHKSLGECVCTWQLASGSPAMVYGLQQAPELNGKLGIAEGWNEESKRWSICLQDGEGKRIKAANLQPDPKTIANVALQFVNTSLTKFDEARTRVNTSLAELHQSAEVAIEQERALEAMDDSPLEIRQKAKEMSRKITFQIAATRNHAKCLEVERAAARAQGISSMVRLMSEFLQLC